MAEPTQKESAILIWRNSEDKTLWQLRDNNPAIEYPNHWGLFGGGIEPDESPTEAMLRELKEELGLVPQLLWDLGDFTHPRWYLHCFLVEEPLNLKGVELHEGADFGLFTDAEVLSGALTSPKFGKTFPLCPPLLEIFTKLKDREFLRFPPPAVPISAE